MRQFLSVLLLATLVLTVGFAHPGLAADLANGEKIFNANCAACHVGGTNLVMRTKTLKLEALKKYNMNSLDAIMNQIEYGKNSMPAFGARFSDRQIADVASYVLEQAKSGW
ncbi:MAG: c-type cytochrome [Desertifilum sp. SIO1I2]|nr:c-type cytochrome [Desertifilum sp. SIO1I2]